MADFMASRLEKLDAQPEAQKLLGQFLTHPGSQTFLWVGPEGSGKKTYALAFARSLFCHQGPDCPGCPACRQVLAKTYPDLFWVEREEGKSELNVEAVRELDRKLANAPLAGAWKLAVFPEADRMNPAAQNAFLKTLEEPPANTILILLAEKTGNFLPTVLSRCRLIRFPALPTAILERLLVQHKGWRKEEAHRAAQEANGNMTLALKFGNPDWTQFRDKVCSDFDQALQGSDELWLTLGSEYDKWEPEFLGEREWTATQRKAEVLKAAFQVYLGLWSRRLSGEVEIPAKLSSLTPDKVLKCLQKHQDMIPTYLNAKMLLDHLFLELREGFQKSELDDRSFLELSTQI